MKIKFLSHNKRYIRRLAALSILGVALTACSVQKMPGNEDKSGNRKTEEPKESSEETTAPESTPDVLVYYDVEGNRYEMIIDERVPKHDYDWKKLTHTPDAKKHPETYDDGKYTIRHGVDVSHHNGTINWKKVKKAGYEFAFLRLGYRGYGEEGNLCVDREFQSSFKAARAAGLDLGVYFFSQAVNEKETREEAKLVLRELNNSKLELPVVFDPEYIKEDEARTDGVSKEQFTKNALVFFEEMEKAGYQPAIYTNLYCQDHMFDLARINPYPIWYADYRPEPQTPYYFSFWQYSESGKVPGVSGNCDLDVEFVEESAAKQQ